MYCNKCGTYLPNNSNFCLCCGASTVKNKINKVTFVCKKKYICSRSGHELQAYNLNTGKESSWNMSQERAHMENLVSQRFYYLLIFYGIVIAGAFQIISQNYYIQSFLLISSAITFLMSLTIYRAQKKLNIIICYLFDDKRHPAYIINSAAKGSSQRNLLGYVIPTICWASLFISFFISLVFMFR